GEDQVSWHFNVCLGLWFYPGGKLQLWVNPYCFLLNLA
ncbi:MAG: hypothetical protein ACI974_001488, partial [Paraglaciecola sp.]